MRTLTNISTTVSGATRIEKAIKLFFEKVGDVYDNPHNVEFAWLSDNTVYIAAPWPGTKRKENISVEIGLEASNYTVFTKLFGVRDKARPAIDNVTPLHLKKLYQKGLAELYCFLDETGQRCLSFRKGAKFLKATDEENCEYEVYEPLDTVQDIIEYTRRHYRHRD